METVLIDIRNNDFLKEQFNGKDFINLQELIDEFEQAVGDVEWLTEKINDMSKENNEYDSYLDDVRNEMRDLSE